MTRLIGLAGAKESGKDEVADHMVRSHGWMRKFFSAPLLEHMMILDPLIQLDHPVHVYTAGTVLPLSEILEHESYTMAKRHREFRRLLQVYGTDIIRHKIGEDYWVRAMKQEICSAWSGGRDVVVTGVRFDNEAAMIRRLGGIVLEVVRPGYGGDDPHVSEQGVHADETIMNDGTLNDLYAVAETYA